MPHDHHAGTPCWVDLATATPDESKAFYGAVLGWTFEDQGAALDHYSHALALGHHAAGLRRVPEDGPPAWLVYLRTEDLDGDLARLEAAGCTRTLGPLAAGERGRMAFLTDPYGAAFGLWEAGDFAGFDAMGMAGTPAWFEVNTPEGEALRDLFAEAFGLGADKLDGMAYWTLKAGGRPRFGVLQMTAEWEGIRPHWMTYFAVADADAACEVIRREGGEVCHGPFDTPFGRMAVCNDPQGAVFTVIVPADAG